MVFFLNNKYEKKIKSFVNEENIYGGLYFLRHIVTVTWGQTTAVIKDGSPFFLFFLFINIFFFLKTSTEARAKGLCHVLERLQK